jgi:hypothetical protein
MPLEVYSTNLAAVPSAGPLSAGNAGVVTEAHGAHILPYAPLAVWRLRCPLSQLRGGRSIAGSVMPNLNRKAASVLVSNKFYKLAL